MQKRICPNCFEIWFSSDSSQPWGCEKCGCNIPVPKDEIIPGEPILFVNGGRK